MSAPSFSYTCAAVALGALLGCEVDVPLAHRESAIVYDRDDREDVFAAPREATRRLAQTAAVAVIPAGRLAREKDGSHRVRAHTLGQTFGLCEDEPFVAQPAAAVCSGVLIDRDLVLTAAHCFAETPCTAHRFVFNYLYAAPDALAPIGDDDVFHCKRVLAREDRDPRDALQIDFAVVQLDRPVLPPRGPAPLRTAALDLGENLTVIGYPSGLPAKIDEGGTVRNIRADYHDFFALDADTFLHSSGSGVFDADGRLAGVIVRGGKDYSWTGACASAQRVQADGVKQWEDATYVARAAEAVCARDPARSALCAVSGCAVGGTEVIGPRDLSWLLVGAIVWRRRRKRATDVPDEP